MSDSLATHANATVGTTPAPRSVAGPALLPESLDWGKGDGLLPAIVQDADSLQVLMLGYMDRNALQATLTKRLVTFYSRSKQRLWTKGETSGHVQHVRSVALDCDGDALLVKVAQTGAACHTGDATCFDSGALQVSA